MAIILFIVVLLVLVLIHEFGHFIVAKKAGIRVDEFAFGFPPRLFGLKRGETTYAFNALPFGGYVKIYGEDPQSVSDEDRGRSFGAAPRWIQGSVILAGIVMNILLAWVLLSAAFMIGVPATSDAAAPYPINDPKLSIIEVVAGSPAATAGLLPGDVLHTVTDAGTVEVTTLPQQVTEFIGPREGHRIEVAFTRGGVASTTVVYPISGIVTGRAAIGISMDMVGIMQLRPLDALIHGARSVVVYTWLIGDGIKDFVLSVVMIRVDLDQVAGPVGLVHAVDKAAGVGLANLFMFVAIFSINLAVFNALPFPALDGGRFLFILIEAIIRRPLPIIATNIMNLLGFALLMLLMLLVTYHEVVKYFFS